MDLSDVDFYGDHPAQEPVQVAGFVENRADVLHMSFSADSTLDVRCDRCGAPFRRDAHSEYECVLSEELQNEDSDGIEIIENGQIDIEDLARSVFILDMDRRNLCSEECKGLCSRCGSNLNLGPCSCKKEIDPRWAKLAALLEEP